MDQIDTSDLQSVLHVISTAGPHPYFRTLIEAGGYPHERICVGCVGAGGALQEEMRALGVTTFALGAERRAQYPVATMRLARMIRRLRPSIVQSHLVDGSLVGLSAARLAATAAIFTAHHSHELPFHGRKLRWPDALCAGPLSDRTIAPSRQVAETLTEHTGTLPWKIDVVHHGFDLARLDPAHAEPERVRRELGLQDAVVLGAVGRLYGIKNYEALVRAFAAARSRLPEAVLVIAGPGDAEPLRRLAHELGIAEQVRLIGPRSDVPDLLAAYDAFVHPALAESFGMVVVEAMAMCRPVLSTPVGIAPELVETGVTGVLASGGGVSELSDALTTLAELRPHWAALGAAARARATGFDARAMVAAYGRVYSSVLAERNRPAAKGSSTTADR